MTETSSNQLGIALAENASLQEFGIYVDSLDPVTGDNIFSGVSSNKSIDKVKFFGRLCNVPGRPLYTLLTKCPSLTELDLFCSLFDTNCLKDIAEGLKQNPGFKKLDLSTSNAPSIPIELFDSIVTQHNLTHLRLDETFMGADQAIVKNLGRSIKHLKHLVVLKLRLNQFGTMFSSILLRKILTYSKSLRTLDFGNNQCEDENASLIANILSTNSSLTKLRLDENELTDQGIGEITKAISQSRTLKLITLSQNHFTDASTTNFVDMVRENSSLEKLNVSFSGLNIAVESIIDTLETENYSIKCCWVFGSVVDRKKLTELYKRTDKCCQRNKEIANIAKAHLVFCFFALAHIFKKDLLPELIEGFRRNLCRLSQRGIRKQEALMYNTPHKKKKKKK